jgi:hypothetical protein
MAAIGVKPGNAGRRNRHAKWKQPLPLDPQEKGIVHKLLDAGVQIVDARRALYQRRRFPNTRNRCRTCDWSTKSLVHRRLCPAYRGPEPRKPVGGRYAGVKVAWLN